MKEKETLEDKITKLKNQNISANSSLSVLNSKLTEKELEISHISKQLQDFNLVGQEINSLKTKIKDINEENKRLKKKNSQEGKSFQEKISRLKKEKEEYKHRCSSAQEEIQRLNSQLEKNSTNPIQTPETGGANVQPDNPFEMLARF
jgi:chromosome segregation ATPase